MIPLSDNVRVRTFPYVNWSIIAINFAVWLFIEIPNPDAVTNGSFYPCAVENACHTAEPWGLAWLTAMFLHASWSHILGNMVFLGVFGRNVEDAYGHLQYLAFYLASGFVAMAAQTAATLIRGSAQDATVANLGASGAIAGVLGAYIVLYPRSEVRGLFGIFPARIAAWVYLGVWFLYQLYEANFGSDSGVAFFAHVGGFVFGLVVTVLLLNTGRIRTTISAGVDTGPVVV